MGALLPNLARRLGSWLLAIRGRLQRLSARDRSDSEPIAPGERLLRRIPRQWCDPSSTEPILRLAFEPREADTDGLSLFREVFITPTDLAQTGGKPPYFVARLTVEDIGALELTVVPRPDSRQPPGHAIIPEITYQSMRADKKASKELQRALATIAAQDIPFSPDDDPIEQ